MPQHRRRLSFGLLAIAMLAGSTAQPRAEEIVVTLFGTGMFGAPYAVAMEKGYFKEAGVDVTEIAGGGGGGSVVRNVMASPLPFGEVGTPSAIAAFKQGLPIIIVGAGGRSFDNNWVTMPGSKIKSIKDMIGKKVAYTSPKGISDIFVQMLLTKNGVDPSQVNRIAAGSYGAGLTLLQNGGVDLAPVTEPLRTQTEGKYDIVFTAKDNLPPIISAGTIVPREFAAKNPGKIKALLLARRRGVDFIYSNPEEAGKLVAKQYKLPEDVGVRAIVAMAKARQWSAGEVDLPEFNNIAEGMRLIGELKGDVDWKSMIDTSYLPDDLRAKSSAEIRK